MAETPTSNAAVLAKVESLSNWMADIAKDSREGRDLALTIRTMLETQNMPAQLAALRGDTEKGLQAARSDLVNAQTHIRQEVHDLVVRVQALEAKQNRTDGATGLMGWLIRHAPWLAGAFAAFAGGVALKENLPS